jgi:hypothetical protein
MNTRITTLLVVLIAAIVGLGYLFAKESREAEAPPSEPVSNEVEAAITAQSDAFGQELKQVSLLAPAADVRAAMEAHYKPYLAPALLAAWEADPTQALGRTVSSPWPERINIAAITPVDAGRYELSGTVVEVTSVDSAPVSTYPVTLTFEKRGETWLIVSVAKGATSALPAAATITGTSECLPHRNASGPQTMECAFGLKEEGTGKHYALDLRATNQLDVPTGQRMSVTGTLVPANQLNTDMWQKYDIVGIIAVTKVELTK